MQKAKKKSANFWSDGIDLADFEKLNLGIMFWISFLIGAYNELFRDGCSMVWQYVILGVGALFVARKAFSYFKPETYYSKGNNQSNDQI
jgi:hypothetical protein